MTIQALSLNTVFPWYLEDVDDYQYHMSIPVLSLNTALTWYLEDYQISYFPWERADGSYRTHVLTVAPFSGTAIPSTPSLRDNDVKSGDEDNVLVPQFSGRTLGNDEHYNLVHYDIPFSQRDTCWEMDVDEELEPRTN
jgi:hypothetical protein